jgi:hypothetical protein
MTPNPWSMEAERELFALYQSGVSPTRIAEKMGLTRGQIHGKCSRMGLSFKKRAEPGFMRQRIPVPTRPAIEPWQGRATSPFEATREIIREVAEKHWLTLDDVLSDKSRYRRVTWVRQEAMYEVFRQRPNMTYPAIGLIFKRDHTSCIHGVKAHCARIGRRYEDVRDEHNRTGLLRAEVFAAYGQAMRQAA